jgi:hypothetical protein
MANSPAFATDPRIGFVQVTGASAGIRDGAGLTSNAATLLVGGVSGTRVAEITAHASVTTTLGMVRVFISGVDGNGNTVVRMWDELSIPAQVPSATVKGARSTTLYNNLILPSPSWRLIVTTENANAINVFALGADL